MVLLWSTVPPSIVKSFSKVRMSTTFGKLVSVRGLFDRIVAAIIGNAAFLAPLIVTFPSKLFPPIISK